ncbi:MAG: hypothetical protein LWW75_04980 [Chlorobiales bacterium]|nr:hypothetical protein [Chlorobiales bacterium]
MNLESFMNALEKAAFDLGVVRSAVVVANLYDEPGIAASIMKENCLLSMNCENFCEYDKEALRKIAKEPGMKLKGL